MKNIAFSLLILSLLLLSDLAIAKEQVVTNLIYTEKGLAGKQVMTKLSDSQYLGSLDVR